MNEFRIKYYKKPDGSAPAREFIEAQPPKMRARLVDAVKQLSAKGNALREPHSKFLQDGIFELRVQAEGDIARVLYFFFVGKKIVLTNGFVKKTEKTPTKEIRLAQKYRDDYKQFMEGLYHAGHKHD